MDKMCRNGKGIPLLCKYLFENILDSVQESNLNLKTTEKQSRSQCFRWQCTLLESINVTIWGLVYSNLSGQNCTGAVCFPRASAFLYQDHSTKAYLSCFIIFHQWYIILATDSVITWTPSLLTLPSPHNTLHYTVPTLKTDKSKIILHM
jgi:hypothetical protein